MLQVLIVDDEHLILNGIRLMITDMLNVHFPVDIITANSALEALDHMFKHTPDLILTDIRMPVMDGFTMIEKITAAGYLGDIAILTSHADFEYARTAIRYGVIDFLLKPINEAALKEILQKTYEKKALRLKESKESSLLHILSMMLYGTPALEPFLTRDLMDDLFPHQYFTVIVIDTLIPQPSLSSLKSLLLNYYDKCYCFFLKEKHEVVAICNHAAFFVKPGALPTAIQQLVYDDYFLGISISSTSIDKLHELYLNACQRIFYQKAFGNDMNSAEIASFTYNGSIAILLETDETIIAKKIKDIFLGQLQVEHPNSAYLNNLYTGFFQNIVLYLERSGLLAKVNTSPSVEIQNADELFHLVTKQIIEIRTALSEQANDTKSNAIIGQILNYINEHYQNDISLDDIGDAIGLNPRYICTLLKKRTDSSYLTWLHMKRIKVAKELLHKNHLTIEQIAKDVGYNSSTQLGRVFRKYENMSPSDYRDGLAT